MFDLKKIINWFKCEPVDENKQRWDRIKKLSAEEKFDFIYDAYKVICKYRCYSHLKSYKDFGELGAKVILQCNHGVRLEELILTWHNGSCLKKIFYVNDIKMLTIRDSIYSHDLEWHFEKDKYYDDFNEILTNCYNDAEMLLGEVNDYIGSNLRGYVSK